MRNFDLGPCTMDSWRLKIALESYFDEHGTEAWEILGESRCADHVVHISAKVDCNGFEGSPSGTRRE